jgi:hypothetical protein
MTEGSNREPTTKHNYKSGSNAAFFMPRSFSFCVENIDFFPVT